MMSPRQLEVWPLLAEGLTNVRIAELLGITEKTVKAHVTAILKELEVDTRTRAAVLFMRPDLRKPADCSCDFARTGRHGRDCTSLRPHAVTES